VTNLGMAESSVGLFLSLWVGGGLLANFVWSQVIDHAGSRAALFGSGVLAIASPAVACAVILIPEGWMPAPAFLSGLVAENGVDGRQFLFMSTFVLNSFAFNGRLISNMTYLLEMAPAERRPTYIGLANTLTFPLALLPVAGGALAGYTSYGWLFLVAAAFGVAGLWSVRKLVRAAVFKDAHEVLAEERR
jgi:MFS family permease